MKFFGAVFAAVLLFTLPTYAQIQVTTPKDAATSGTLTTLTTDTVSLPISGGQWGTVQFIATAAGTATATAQVTLDGTNWIPAPYATRLSTLSANPTVQPIASTTLVTNDVWEIPLPGNTLSFRLLCGASGTTTSVVIRAGRVYTPGTEVVAVMYDQSEGGIGAGLSTGVLDFSGWKTASILLRTPTTQAFSFNEVDDAGTAVFPSVASTVNTNAVMLLSSLAAAAGPATLGASAHQPYSITEKRFSITLLAGGTVSVGRARVVFRR